MATLPSIFWVSYSHHHVSMNMTVDTDISHKGAPRQSGVCVVGGVRNACKQIITPWETRHETYKTRAVSDKNSLWCKEADFFLRLFFFYWFKAAHLKFRPAEGLLKKHWFQLVRWIKLLGVRVRKWVCVWFSVCQNLYKCGTHKDRKRSTDNNDNNLINLQ